MDTVSPVLSVSEIFLNRPLEELEADRYRKEVEESRRLEEIREEKRERLEEKRLRKRRRKTDTGGITLLHGNESRFARLIRCQSV